MTNYWKKAVDSKIEVSFMGIGRLDARGVAPFTLLDTATTAC